VCRIETLETMATTIYGASTNFNASAPLAGPPRVPRALPRSGTPLALRYHKKHAENVEGRGVLSQWSAKGGRLESEHPLEIGDWIHLDIRKVRGGTAPRKKGLARVVAPAPAPSAGYSYGVQFYRGIQSRVGYALYALAPWAALLLFALGTINVVLLKTNNVLYFWYSPLTNLYSILISSYILSRFALSQFYSPVRDRGYRPPVSVVIACKNEEESIGRTIDCIYESDYPRDRLEVIAVNDGSTDGTLEEMRRAESRHPNLTVIDFGRNLGKRHGMAAGAKAARGAILVYVDSDSFVRRDTLAQIVQDFARPEVGAVCGHAYVSNARKNLLTKMQDVRYYVAFRVVKAAESLFGTVACCSGCLAAYRRSYVMEILDEWLHQRFLGTEATFGDDRSLTNYMLRRYRVVYNANAVCSTIVPERYRQFFKQQLRWKKSWVRETFIASLFMWRRHPFAAFFFYLGAIFPVISPFVAFNALVVPLLKSGTVSFLYIYGATLMAAMYGLYYLARCRSRLWVYGIVFSFFYMFVLVWQTYYALLTVRRNHWGTR
jgi:hyaluronan synthase